MTDKERLEAGFEELDTEIEKLEMRESVEKLFTNSDMTIEPGDTQ